MATDPAPEGPDHVLVVPRALVALFRAARDWRAAEDRRGRCPTEVDDFLEQATEAALTRFIAGLPPVDYVKLFSGVVYAGLVSALGNDLEQAAREYVRAFIAGALDFGPRPAGGDAPSGCLPGIRLVIEESSSG